MAQVTKEYLWDKYSDMSDNSHMGKQCKNCVHCMIMKLDNGEEMERYYKEHGDEE